MRHVVIIGGGAIGSAVAYFLTREPGLEVTVVERDFSYSRASSALSASSIRQQYSTAINIRLSAYGIEFMRNIGRTLSVGDDSPDIGLVEPGYLYLASGTGEAALRRNHAVQRAHGVDVVLLEPGQLAARFPWLSSRDLALGSLGLSGEGWYDGYGLLQAFRNKALAQGCRYLQAEASGLVMQGPRAIGVQLADGRTLHCDEAVNAAGAWAARVAGWAGIDLPVRARRRSVFSFSCPDALPACPLVIDTSGIWFRPEGRQFICGFAPDPAADPDDAPLDVEHEVFERFIWPTLAARVPAFEAIRVTGGWAGYYEMNLFDHNAIVGLHPACTNLYFANGFSGHGLQQSPAVGRAIAELIRAGRFETLDLSDVSFARILNDKPLMEDSVI